MNTNHPSKYQVRAYMQQRREEKTPPPKPEEIRRNLDWGLTQSVRDTGR